MTDGRPLGSGSDSPSPSRVTAAMVAARAGVSAATVSLVANGNHAGRVSEDRVIDVRKAIRELNYTVDPVASSLVKGSSNLIIFVNPRIENPYFGNVITGIRESLGFDYLLLVAVVSHERRLRATGMQELLSFRPAGLLITGSSAQLLAEFNIDRPTVVLDSPQVAGLAPSVNFDLSQGAYALADHLAALGHRKVAYVDATIQAPSFSLRRQYFYDRARGHGIVEPKLNDVRSIIDIGASAMAFHDAWVAWRRSGVTAVVCATDTHAYGVLEEARALDIDVPGTLAVAGFDDLPYSTVVHPSLTSVSLPGHTLGRTAADKLRELIEGGEITPTPRLDTRLVVRASTGEKSR